MYILKWIYSGNVNGLVCMFSIIPIIFGSNTYLTSSNYLTIIKNHIQEEASIKDMIRLKDCPEREVSGVSFS